MAAAFLPKERTKKKKGKTKRHMRFALREAGVGAPPKEDITEATP